MKHVVVMGLVLCLFGAGLAGCKNTEQGAEQDTANNAKAVQQASQHAADQTKQAADNTANAAKKGAKNAAAALSVTPKVKTAILADENLRDPNNLINVESANNVVHLKGHVTTSALKKEAGADASRALKDMGATDRLSNELTVTGS